MFVVFYVPLESAPVDGALRVFVENSARLWHGRVGVSATKTCQDDG